MKGGGSARTRPPPGLWSAGDHPRAPDALPGTDLPPIPPGSWPALWALVIGFFMILIDSTIVSVAVPALMRSFDAGINEVMWVTSAYLLAYAVPLLITGRLGDRIGPKKVYLTGLAGLHARLVVVRADRRAGAGHRRPGRRPRGPGAGRLDDDAADHGGHHPHLASTCSGSS